MKWICDSSGFQVGADHERGVNEGVEVLGTIEGECSVADENWQCFVHILLAHHQFTA